VDGLTDSILAWLQANEGPLAYLVIGLAALIEYVFPPFPGDTVTLFGVFLAATAGFSWIWVYVAINVGSVAGGMLAYGFGRWIAEHRDVREPRFLRAQQARRAVDLLTERFAEHGAVYLAINRFIPALRAFFFVAAGLARLPPWKVVVFGAISALAWNAIVVAVGSVVGHELERLQAFAQSYALWSIGAVAVVALAIGVRWFYRRRRPRADAPGQGEPKGEE
jgi:membrane protein DedA with SNARE-associated domain